MLQKKMIQDLIVKKIYMILIMKMKTRAIECLDKTIVNIPPGAVC